MSEAFAHGHILTCTCALGELQCYTRVLKGHIALSTVVFPVGTTGHTLDILARVPLWQAGLDYRHGTGHGVGAYLNVHEVGLFCLYSSTERGRRFCLYSSTERFI